MNRRIQIIAGTLIVVLFLAFGFWFWSLGAVASESVPQIRVEVTKATVEIRHRDAAGWSKIDTAQEVAVGDMVRTDKDGRAEIRWGDRGVTRLDSDTTLVVDELPADVSGVTRAAIKFRLNTGRVWSRVLKLFGPDSAFEVRTDSVVATVRGTAYGVSLVGTSTEVAVDQGVVEAAPLKGGNGVFVRQGRLGDFAADGSPRYVRDLGDTDTWAKANAQYDKEFDDALRQETLARFQKSQKPAPEWLIELSEAAHIQLGLGGDSAKLVSEYLNRRIAALAVGRNISGDRIKNLVRLADAAGRDKAAGTIRLALHLVDDAGLDRRLGDPGTHKLDLLEELRAELLSDSPAGKFDADIIGLGEDMFKTWTADGVKFDQDLRNRILAVRGDLAKADGITDRTRDGLDRDALALLDFFGSNAPVVSPATVTSTMAGPTSTPATAAGRPEEREGGAAVSSSGAAVGQPQQPQPQTGSNTPAVGCEYRELTLMAKPDHDVDVGSAVALTLYGTCSDGKVDDLSARATFNAGYADDGKVDGPTFYPAKAGSLTVYGAIQLAGKVRSANTMINVKPTVRKVTGVKVNSLGPTTLTTGQSSPLEAIATYSDGTNSGVTYQCKWLTSDERLAMVSERRLQTLSGTGDVSATCTYTENGITVFGSVMFTIKLDPSLLNQPGGSATQSPVRGLLK